MSSIRIFYILFIFTLFGASYSQMTQTGSKGLLRTHSAQTLGIGTLGVGTSMQLSFDNDYVKRVFEFDINDNTSLKRDSSSSIKPTYLSTYYNLSYGLLDYLDLTVGIPYYIDNNGIGDGKDNATGDLHVAMKFQYPPYEHSHVFDMTYFGEFFIPTGNENRGLYPRQPYYTHSQNKKQERALRDSLTTMLDGLNDDAQSYDTLQSYIQSGRIPTETNYYGAGYLSFLAKMLWTFDASQINPDVDLKWHLNFGALFTGKSDKDNIFELGSAIEWTPHAAVTLFTDFYGQARFSQLTAGFDLGKEPLVLGSGASFNIPGGAHIILAFDKSFSLAKYSNIYYNPDKKQVYETKIYPEYGLSVTACWSGSVLGGDGDADGVPDKMDRCPQDPEDVDGFEDTDGCPDNDNDNDGIPDIRDRCPNKAEDFDNFQDEDGCPDNDNDKDGIADSLDKCPIDPEDRDGYEDKDGCPDIDNDKDGISDQFDKCPIDAEDVDGFEDKDGCPDIDNDKDAIPDSTDKCPNVAENINGFQDEDGCPDQKTAEIKGTIVLEGVNFKTGSAELTYESGTVLDKVVESMSAYPDVCIEIRGHTDNSGLRKKNQELSQERAASVRLYILSKGIAPNRIKALGMGSKQPIASNTTEEGKAKNRRIEMYRINCQ